jgi:hypothetical protein
MSVKGMVDSTWSPVYHLKSKMIPAIEDYQSHIELEIINMTVQTTSSASDLRIRIPLFECLEF